MQEKKADILLIEESFLKSDDKLYVPASSYLSWWQANSSRRRLVYHNKQ